MNSEEHVVLSVMKRGKIHTVTCACNETFQSIESEALARSYHSAHRLIIRKRGAKV